MGRTESYGKALLLDAAERIVAAGGPRALTVESLSSESGAPVGSIYHRFSSRAVLGAELWIRAVGRFQAGLIAALEGPDPLQAGVQAALHTLRWSRLNMPSARMLLLYREVDFLADDLPESWCKRAADLNPPLLEALRAYSTRLFHSSGTSELRRVGVAIIDIPYGAVHRHLAAGKPIPAQVDGLVAEAAEAILGKEARST
jgi:AcrR family transcriptional regulator